MNTQYQVKFSGSDEFPIIVLNDGQGARAHIAPHAGFNAFSFVVPRGNNDYEVFIGPQSDEELRKGGIEFGNPILFPFPNRTRDGRYEFDGETHQLDINWKDGHAIHGLVLDRKWNVVESGEDEARGAFVTATIQTDEHADIQRQYPFACELRLTYSLREGVLRLFAQVTNTGQKRLPMGFGIHPWFHAPLAPEGNRAECLLTLPARGRWELESDEQLVPTGRVLPLDRTYDFSRGQELQQIFLDDIWTQLIYTNDEHVTTLEDAGSQLKLEVRASSNFREHVVYAPLDKNLICLEPYTMTTDFVNLSTRGVDAGMTVLAPGEKWSGSISISCRDTSAK